MKRGLKITTKQNVNLLIIGVLMTAIFGVIDQWMTDLNRINIFAGFALDLADHYLASVESLQSTLAFAQGTVSVISMVSWTVSLCLWTGYVLLFKAFCAIGKVMDETGQKGIGLLKIALVLEFVMSFGIPGLTYMLALGAYTLEVIGYYKLSCSEALNQRGRSGAKLIFISFIVLLFVSLFLGYIPFVQAFVAMFSYFLYIHGWLKMKNSFVAVVC